MPSSVTATITSVTQAQIQSSGAFSTTINGSPNLSFQRAFTSSNITKQYFATYSVTTSATSVDLTSLTNALGEAVSFSTVKHLHVINRDTANNLTVGGGTNGLFTALPFTLIGYSGAANNTNNGSDLNLTTNITVDGTHKILTLQASAGTISVDVFVLGT